MYIYIYIYRERERKREKDIDMSCGRLGIPADLQLRDEAWDLARARGPSARAKGFGKSVEAEQYECSYEHG